MAELVGNCPRCGAQRVTFDVSASKVVRIEYGWQHWHESFSICRNCHRSTIFLLSESVNGNYEHLHSAGFDGIKGTLNSYVDIERYISLRDTVVATTPEHVPTEIAEVFHEGAICLSVACFNAAGTMFRLCVDLATRTMLPTEEAPGLNAKVRRDLGLRLPWLFERGRLPKELKELSTCIKEDGNDGAHAGTLKKPDAEDLLDFTEALLERLYTEPERLKLAQQRRAERRKLAK